MEGEVIHVDRFGNLITSLRAGDLPADSLVVEVGEAATGLALGALVRVMPG